MNAASRMAELSTRLMSFVQPKERELLCLCPAVITLLIVAIGASTAGLSQPKSFDGAYKGSLECEQSGFEAFRMPLVISIRDGRVIGGASILDIDGREVGPEQGFGTVNPDGTFNFRYILYVPGNYSTHVYYSGTLDGTGGTLIGTQVLTPEITGDVVTRTCKGTFLRVELPKR